MNARDAYLVKIGRALGSTPVRPEVDPDIDALMQRYLRRLESFLPKRRRGRGATPGAVVVARKGDAIVHLKGYGLANLDTGDEITLDTVFDLGSLSKQFTAFAALQTFGASGLETKISKYLRGFPRYADTITIKQLIHHTAALPDYIDLHVAARDAEEDWYARVLRRPDKTWYPQMSRRHKARVVTNRDILELVALQRLLPRDPDKVFEYSNTGYVLLAEIVRRATNQRLSDVLRTKVFSVAGMDHTYVFDETSRFRKNAPEVVHHATCYNAVKGKGFTPVGYSPMNFVYGDGNIHSTIVDMVKWDKFLTLLDRGTICQPQGRREDAERNTRSILWEPAVLPHRKQSEYGAGWNLLKNKYKDNVKAANGRTVTKNFESRAEYHRGEWLAWENYFARAHKWEVPAAGKPVDPDSWENMGIIVLTNNNVPAVRREFYPCMLARQISELCWGHVKEDNILKGINCGLA